MAQSNYVVIKQDYSESDESYKWQIVSDPLTLQSANKRAKSIESMPGDILVVCDLADVSDIINRARSIYAVDELGKVHKAPKFSQIYPYDVDVTWLWLHMGTKVKASDLLFTSAMSMLPERSITKAAYLCAAAVSGHHKKDDLYMEAMATAESFIDGNKIDQTYYDKLCERLRDWCRELGKFNMSQEYNEASMYWYLVRSIFEPTEAYSVTLAITRIFGGKLDHEMLSIVRRAIPLSAIVVAAAKNKSTK